MSRRHDDLDEEDGGVFPPKPLENLEISNRELLDALVQANIIVDNGWGKNVELWKQRRAILLDECLRRMEGTTR